MSKLTRWERECIAKREEAKARGERFRCKEPGCKQRGLLGLYCDEHMAERIKAEVPRPSAHTVPRDGMGFGVGTGIDALPWWRDPANLPHLANALPGDPCWREIRHGVVCGLPEGHDGECSEEKR